MTDKSTTSRENRENDRDGDNPEYLDEGSASTSYTYPPPGPGGYLAPSPHYLPPGANHSGYLVPSPRRLPPGTIYTGASPHFLQPGATYTRPVPSPRYPPPPGTSHNVHAGPDPRRPPPGASQTGYMVQTGWGGPGTLRPPGASNNLYVVQTGWGGPGPSRPLPGAINAIHAAPGPAGPRHRGLQPGVSSTPRRLPTGASSTPQRLPTGLSSTPQLLPPSLSSTSQTGHAMPSPCRPPTASNPSPSTSMPPQATASREGHCTRPHLPDRKPPTHINYDFDKGCAFEITMNWRGRGGGHALGVITKPNGEREYHFYADVYNITEQTCEVMTWNQFSPYLTDPESRVYKAIYSSLPHIHRAQSQASPVEGPHWQPATLPPKSSQPQKVPEIVVQAIGHKP